MNELKIFQNEEFGQVRTVTINDEPWFVGKDVAEILGYSNARKTLADHVDEEDKGVTKCDTLGGMQDLTVINESGLYSLILSSKMPKAKQFKHWVTSEVLPAIRKHGMYAVDDLINDPEMAIKAFTALKEERERNKELQADVNRMKPKEIFADAVACSSTSIPVGDLAKILKQNGIKIGRNYLFKKLRDEGFLIKGGSSKNMPTQRSMELGLFEVTEGSFINSMGDNVTTKTTKVTGKGQVYFINRYLKG